VKNKRDYQGLLKRSFLTAQEVMEKQKKTADLGSGQPKQ